MNENMNENTTVTEYNVLDIDRLWKIVCYRKYWSLIIYITIITATILVTLSLPKKYISEALILINKSSSTNLAEINPYVLDKATSSSKGISSFLSSGGGISEEMDIIKSPLVLDNVIKENHIVYESGPKQNSPISTEDLLEQNNLTFENTKDSNIISIKYKSISPKLSYNIVNSVIKNYQNISETINSKKATKDRTFLKEELAKTEKELAQYSQEMKQYKSQTNYVDPELEIKLLSSAQNLNLYKRTTANKINQIPETEQKTNELKLKLESTLQKFNMLKERYEWAFLVEKMAQNATNITILKKPEIKQLFEKSEPSLKKNIIVAVVVSIILSSLFAFFLEVTELTLTFLSLTPTKLFWFSQQTKRDYLNNLVLTLKQDLSALNINNLNIISFDLNEKDLELFKSNLDSFLTTIDKYKILNFETTTNPVEVFNFIESSSAILLLGKIGVSNKELFLKTEELSLEKNKLLAKVILY